jgi:hypothetical protein
VRDIETNPCLTRVVRDEGCAVEIAQLDAVRASIERALAGVPPQQRDAIADALLNFAIDRIGAIVSIGALRPLPARAGCDRAFRTRPGDRRPWVVRGR